MTASTARLTAAWVDSFSVIARSSFAIRVTRERRAVSSLDMLVSRTAEGTQEEGKTVRRLCDRGRVRVGERSLIGDGLGLATEVEEELEQTLAPLSATLALLHHQLPRDRYEGRSQGDEKAKGESRNRFIHSGRLTAGPDTWNAAGTPPGPV